MNSKVVEMISARVPSAEAAYSFSRLFEKEVPQLNERTKLVIKPLHVGQLEVPADPNLWLEPAYIWVPRPGFKTLLWRLLWRLFPPARREVAYRKGYTRDIDPRAPILTRVRRLEVKHFQAVSPFRGMAFGLEAPPSSALLFRYVYDAVNDTLYFDLP